MIMSTINEGENVISEAVTLCWLTYLGLLAEYDGGLKHNVMVTVKGKSLARSSQHACAGFGAFV